MFIRLFIRTIVYDEASLIAKEIVSNIPKEFIKSSSVKIEPYWKYDDTLVAEIKLELLKEFGYEVKKKFLNSISDNWIFLGIDNSEAISSKTMEGGSTMNHDIDMIDIYFSE